MRAIFILMNILSTAGIYKTMIHLGVCVEFALFNSRFALYLSRTQVRVSTNKFFNTQDRVSIDAGLKSVEADRVLWSIPVVTRIE